MRRTASFNFVTVAALIALLPAILCAQGAPQDQGPPERGVARMSATKGEVSVRRGDSGEWVAAAVNAPLMVNDRVSTGPGSSAEVQFDAANLIRIGANAEIRLARVDYGHVNIQIAHGTVTFRVLRPSQGQIELATPPVAVRPHGPGAYRIFVKEDGQTEITVRLGNAEIYTPRGIEQLQAGQTMLVRGDPADPEFRVVPAISRDSWDVWNEQRDRELLNSPSGRNVSEGVYGAEDLDKNGRWVDMPTYGEVWTPNVDPDWAPYENGRWVWEDDYGWTWVSYDPWGWAPFHYGRWFWAANYGWCWYPGGFGRHYWSPALVAFFGFGPSVGVGFGFGHVGWVALAPFEPMHPWWGRGYYGGNINHSVNITNVNIAGVYRNARVNNGVMSVSVADFRQGRFNTIARANGSQIHEAGLVRGQLPVAPTAAHLRYSNRAVAHVPRSAENIRFFSHSGPAPAQRTSFAEQQRAMQQYSRQPVAPSATAGAWRRVGEPGPSAAPANRGPSGWQRFGEPRPASTAAPRSYAGWTSPQPGYRPYTTSAPAPSPRPESIRVAPPVVRERSESRSAPRGDSGAHTSRPSGGGGGGGAHSGGGGGGSHGGSGRH